MMSGGVHCGQRVLDALRCILSLTRGPNELFKMKNLPVLRKQSTIFPPLLVFRDARPWCSTIAARGLGAAQGPQKLEGSRCSELHSLALSES